MRGNISPSTMSMAMCLASVIDKASTSDQSLDAQIIGQQAYRITQPLLDLAVLGSMAAKAGPDELASQ